MRRAISKGECTDPQHSIPRPEFGGLSLHEYELEHVKLLRSYDLPGDFRYKPTEYAHGRPSVVLFPYHSEQSSAWTRFSMHNRFLPHFLHHWKQKYLCAFGIHKVPQGWRNWTSYTCFWCGCTIFNRTHPLNKI